MISDYHDNDEKNYSYSDEENGIKGDLIYDEDHKEDKEDKDFDLLDWEEDPDSEK